MGAIIIAAMSVLAGCTPHVVKCQYFHLKPQPGLAVLAESSSYGECRCMGGKAATEYRLSRTNYVVTFAIGDRWYPELMLDAHDTSGLPLEIRSAHVYESHKGGERSPISVRGKIYRYFVREEKLPEKVIPFQILDQSGAIIGTEKIPFEMRGASALEIDSI